MKNRKRSLRKKWHSGLSAKEISRRIEAVKAAREEQGIVRLASKIARTGR